MDGIIQCCCGAITAKLISKADGTLIPGLMVKSYMHSVYCASCERRTRWRQGKEQAQLEWVEMMFRSMLDDNAYDLYRACEALLDGIKNTMSGERIEQIETMLKEIEPYAKDYE